MPATALLFPGQGAQFVGMGKDLADANEIARETFAQADEILGYSLSKICFEGPAEKLGQTNQSQPAILVHSWAVCRVLAASDAGKALFASASACAGLSLGEYSALAGAGAIKWEDALRLVQKRGEYMQEACENTDSAMASILGMDEEALASACNRASQRAGVVVMANFNSPGQIVISGEKVAVEAAIEYAKEGGAKRAIMLDVAGAFHSPLMEPARARLQKAIEATEFTEPKIPVYANVTASTVSNAEEAKDLLVQQLTAPVLWAASMQALVDRGSERFAEIGPGNVLTGLLRRVARDQEKLTLGTTEQIDAFVNA